jgi:hypothetical protein
LPIELYLRTYYDQGISTHHLGVIAEEYQPQTRTGSSGAPLVANSESRPKYAGSIRIFQANNTHKQPG